MPVYLCDAARCGDFGGPDWRAVRSATASASFQLSWHFPCFIIIGSRVGMSAYQHNLHPYMPASTHVPSRRTAAEAVSTTTRPQRMAAAHMNSCCHAARC